MVSFLVTVFNKEKYIATVLESIKKQVLPVPCECIIINDGSSDRSLEIINETTKSWNNCTIIDQANTGVVQATLKGIGIAQGEFIKFVDGDDLLLEHLTSQQLSLIEKHPQLSYVSCSFGVLSNGIFTPKFNASEQITSTPLSPSDIDVFSGTEALQAILSRKRCPTEALTGMSGGLSRKSHIRLDLATSLASNLHLRQMQDHLVSAVSLLAPESSFAFINKIGFLELSKSSTPDAVKTLSANTNNGRREQVLINHALKTFLPQEEQRQLMQSDLKHILRALTGKPRLSDKLWPRSVYHQVRAARKAPCNDTVVQLYDKLISSLPSNTEQTIYSHKPFAF
jgi:hypothetical protein